MKAIITNIKNMEKTKREDFYNGIKTRYEVLTVLSCPALLHKNASFAYDGGRSVNITVFRKNTLLKMNFGRAARMILNNAFLSGNGNLLLSTFLITDESLHRLIGALWRVYHSNNLRLSQSFFRLINLITERGFKLKEIIPVQGFSRNIMTVRKFLSQYAERLRVFLPFRSGAASGSAGIRNIISSDITHENLFRVHERPNIFSRTSRTENLFFSGGGILPVLEKIYEGIESNYLFYNSSSYQSVKTLYRLTNSLWKIYSGHNLELSRNFTQLINRITEKNRIERAYNHGDIFTASSSLQYLVNALRRAFSGNNLHLRQSLISLVSDIRQAGDVIKTTEKHKETSIRTETKKESVLLLYRLFQPSVSQDYAQLYHPGAVSANVNGQTGSEADRLRRYIDGKPDSASVHRIKTPDTDSLVNTVIQRIKSEQAEQWRLEKLQRGLF